MPSRTQTYGIAVLTTSLAWLVDILLRERFSESSGALYIAAALVSTWYGGFGPGLCAISLTIGINVAFFDHPDLSLAVGVHGFERLILFSMVALVISFLAARIRRNQKLLSDLNFELEDKVKQRTAALNESNQQLEAFCYTLAHDLRAPLRSIQGFADLLIMDQGSELSDEGKTRAERIRNSAERMGRLIMDLLAYTDLSRTDFGLQTVDLEAVVQNVLRMFSDEVDRVGADISVEISAKYVLADRTGIERIIVNLMANALKFSDPDRPLRIHVSSENKPSNVRVSVRDNGIGIDPKYRDRIFGIFERLSFAENSIGTGVGLAIVKRSVERMRGSVGVDSTPGVGSCFWFDLAVVARKEPEPARELAGREQV
jgi:signal transduction histidine kinase